MQGNSDLSSLFRFPISKRILDAGFIYIGNSDTKVQTMSVTKPEKNYYGKSLKTP